MEKLKELLLKKEWTWKDFGEAWERAQKMEWWNEFILWLWKKVTGRLNLEIPAIPVEYLDKVRFRDALAEFLERRK